MLEEQGKQNRGGRRHNKGGINELVLDEGAGSSPTGDFMKNNVEHTSELSCRGWGG